MSTQVTDNVVKILLVEDEPEIREVWQLFLRRSGHEVIEASNGVEALDILQEEVPDLIVLDLMMPNASGDVILGVIRSTPSLVNTKVLVVSAHYDAANLARDLKADGFLAKPVHYDVFLQEVKRLVEG